MPAFRGVAFQLRDNHIDRYSSGTLRADTVVEDKLKVYGHFGDGYGGTHC